MRQPEAQPRQHFQQPCGPASPWPRTPASSSLHEVRAVEIIQNKSPEVACPKGGLKSPPSRVDGTTAQSFPFDGVLRFLGETQTKSFLWSSLAFSFACGTAAACASYHLLRWWSARPATRPVEYGTPVPVPAAAALGPLALMPAGGAPPPLRNFRALPDHNQRVWYRGNARDMPGAGVNRRTRVEINADGELKFSDYAFDRNSDNGANRVYQCATAVYAVPQLQFLGLITRASASMGDQGPVVWGPCVRFQDGYAHVELPVDTVSRLKQWWQAIPMVEDNLPLCFIKAQEVTRSLALTAEAVQFVCLYAAVVSVLYAREPTGDGSLEVIRAAMRGGYKSSRGARLALHEFRLSQRVFVVRVLSSASVGIIVFGSLLFAQALGRVYVQGYKAGQVMNDVIQRGVAAADVSLAAAESGMLQAASRLF